mmetsp:Transcript_18273/g.39333  ORF Transcript_18273/g.39333 Transcript_18273/m.39333 type:complete len:828 (+) Transcript_18273:252-2735(+)|eukprot:CAMPEP_0202896562 /NCGR_PEP_ID=MMETSP1392-20130828/5549_1 /ASSEMBLY_ACC=CAM_ASM_000868 /TAXON_ID=225041 /ORGANISM="Chlamydomonas chlamydogama, Strain SAG 11-48b" /LENGTH=827 /DNA_ID=CAMNT_0049581971 /DNA_START=251 /DNA_END=2734 /DNA_ORIENTATION=-
MAINKSMHAYRLLLRSIAETYASNELNYLGSRSISTFVSPIAQGRAAGVPYPPSWHFQAASDAATARFDPLLITNALQEKEEKCNSQQLAPGSLLLAQQRPLQQLLMISGTTDPVLWHTLELRRNISFLRFLTGSAGPKTSSRSAPVPDAEDCDDAFENLEAVRTRLDKLKRPSTIKSWDQTLLDALKATGNGLVAVLRFLAGVPGYLASFRSMTREDWAKWRSSTWKTIKHEAHHYWVGTKLLWYDVKIAARLALKTLRGKELTRRERKQLTRTAADLFRLVPMIIIVVIPFLEFALPVLLRLFPNMLPSTYEDKLKKEEELKRRLSVKLELARFLQDTVAEMAVEMAARKAGEDKNRAKDLLEFVKKVRAGEAVENSDILRFAQLFNDELTLDNLERVQLVSMCQFVGISPFGTDAFLVSRLRAHLQKVKSDDYEIEKEGLENLTEEELRAACRARGIRALYGEGAVPIMRRHLQDWLDLSLHRGLPSSLLLLSRAFTITAQVKDVAAKKDLAYAKLKDTIGVIPEEVVEKVSIEALGETPTGLEGLQKKLELLKREEALIREELARAEAAQKKAAATAAAAAAAAAAPAAAAAAAAVPAAAAAVAQQAAASAAEMLKAQSMSEEEKLVREKEVRDRRISATIQALMDLASNGVAKERTMFMDLLKKETDRVNADLAKTVATTQGGVRSLTFTNRGLEADAAQEVEGADKGAVPDALSQRVTKLLASIEKELDKVENTISKGMRVLDTDHDGIISQQELQKAITFLKEQLTAEEFQQLYEKLGGVAAEQGSAGIQVANLIEAATKKEEGGQDKGGAQEVVKIHTQ